MRLLQGSQSRRHLGSSLRRWQSGAQPTSHPPAQRRSSSSSSSCCGSAAPAAQLPRGPAVPLRRFCCGARRPLGLGRPLQLRGCRLWGRRPGRLRLATRAMRRVLPETVQPTASAWRHPRAPRHLRPGPQLPGGLQQATALRQHRQRRAGSGRLRPHPQRRGPLRSQAAARQAGPPLPPGPPTGRAGKRAVLAQQVRRVVTAETALPPRCYFKVLCHIVIAERALPLAFR